MYVFEAPFAKVNESHCSWFGSHTGFTESRNASESVIGCEVLGLKMVKSDCQLSL